MASGASRRERKVVTVVFCDLVGFTSRAESMDPEDVEAFLDPYHQHVRSVLERYGGTVEKFIGDAVMALFGAPAAHEDDAERAVRAALVIRDWARDDERVQVRLGVTTGEAVIRLDARPEAGEGMASGDVVNTAARLQSAASVNAVLVDETTFRATRHVIEHDEAAFVEAKGKAAPIPVWQPRQPRTRFGVDVAHEARAELVGRERELAVLRDVFERAVHGRAPQLITLVGVPGIGKSRLVYELSLIARDDEKLITWRQGRCLAYGDGVTLWALGEIVKAQVGILEQDSVGDVHEKIRATVAALFDERDARWVEQHVLALVGLAEEAELGGDRRSEAFSAWRRFLEGLAEIRPLVLVFEDLHWADASLLDFVDELVEWVTDVPLLVVATARPELLDRRPDWGGGKLDATTLALAPLSDEQTARLLVALLDRPLIAADSQQALIERAGGNPLYAEQFADLYLERESVEDLSLPETLQGIISARLDGLPREEKGLLQDAAVVGKVFWAGGLRRGEHEATEALHSLERKGFVRRQRRSSVEGDNEFAFAHALVRDVAYGQIPRAERAAKHQRIAEWIESLGRREDHCEMLAYHWGSALELARAAGANGSELVDRTRHALRDAGDRAFGLNAFVTAISYYEEALALWPADDEDLPRLLLRRAHALQIADDLRAGSSLNEAAAALRAAGEIEPLAECESIHAQYLWYRGQRDAAYERLARAEELVAQGADSPAKARVLCLGARFRMLAGDEEEALRVAGEALALAEALDLDELRAHALATIGTAKPGMSGVEDLESALRIAVDASSPIASTIVNNLAVARFRSGDLRGAKELYLEAVELAERYGDGTGRRWARGNDLFADFFLGNWDDAERAADAFILECESTLHYQEYQARDVRANVRLARGDSEGALQDWGRALEIAREAKDPQALIPTLLTYARGLTFLGRIDQAHALADEGLDLLRQHPAMRGVLGIMAGIADDLDLRDRVLDLFDSPPDGVWEEAAYGAAKHDYVRVAALYSHAGAQTQAAAAHLDAASMLIDHGRRKEGEVELQSALAFYRSVGATFFIRRAEALLPASA